MGRDTGAARTKSPGASKHGDGMTKEVKVEDGWENVVLELKKDQKQLL